MTTITRSKNFKEFQKTRRFSPDLRQEEAVAYVFSAEKNPVPGFLYDDLYYIEIRGNAFYAVVECLSLKSHVLDSIEKDLFDYSSLL